MFYTIFVHSARPNVLSIRQSATGRLQQRETTTVLPSMTMKDSPFC